MNSLLTTDVAAGLSGPDWLRSRRIDASARFLATPMPTSDEEVWRYGRIDELAFDDFLPLVGFADAPSDEISTATAGAIPAGARAMLDSVPQRAGALITYNGRIIHSEIQPEWVTRGVGFGALTDVDGAVGLGSVADGAFDFFGLANDAFATDPVALIVPRGVVVDAPFLVIDWVDLEGSMTFPRLLVRVGEDAEVTVFEHHGGDNVRALSVPITELDVEQAGRLRYLNVQERGRQTWQIASQLSRVAQDGTILAAQVALGGAYARTRADCRLAGRGASGDLLAIYFGEFDQTLDFRTFQDHLAPDTTSRLLFKGAVGGESRSIYTGLIKVRPQAHGTNAFQTNRTIKLSERAWAESVPNLEIENNDVHCSHASTVGPIDEDQRFYLESRGVPPQVAEQLVVAGFYDEVLAQLPVAEVVAPLRERIVERLERRDRVEVTA
ncbi:MAG: SufD family Fe-S cluster assembly protein [Actinomycetes bacterium]